MALIIPDEDLTPIPAIVAPVPAALLTDFWTFDLTFGQASATLPNSFGIVSIFAIDAEHILALQDTGGDAYRLDLFAGGSGFSLGLMEWSGTPTIRVTVDVPDSTISVEVLEGAVTFGGGWDASDATSATKTIAPWTWASGAELQVGGFFDLFVLDGVVSRVADEDGAGPVAEPIEGSAAGSSSTTATISARAAISGSAAGAASTTATVSARASLSGAAAGAAESTGTISARAVLAGSSAGSSTATGRLSDANALDAPVSPERTYVIAPEDRVYVIPPEDRTYTITRAA